MSTLHKHNRRFSTWYFHVSVRHASDVPVNVKWQTTHSSGNYKSNTSLDHHHTYGGYRPTRMVAIDAWSPPALDRRRKRPFCTWNVRQMDKHYLAVEPSNWVFLGSFWQIDFKRMHNEAVWKPGAWIWLEAGGQWLSELARYMAEVHAISFGNAKYSVDIIIPADARKFNQWHCYAGYGSSVGMEWPAACFNCMQAVSLNTSYQTDALGLLASTVVQ